MRTSLTIILPLEGKKVSTEILGMDEVRAALEQPLEHTFRCTLCPTVGTVSSMWVIERRNGVLIPICDRCADRVELSTHTHAAVRKLPQVLERHLRVAGSQQYRLWQGALGHVPPVHTHR